MHDPEMAAERAQAVADAERIIGAYRAEQEAAAELAAIVAQEFAATFLRHIETLVERINAAFTTFFDGLRRAWVEFQGALEIMQEPPRATAVRRRSPAPRVIRPTVAASSSRPDHYPFPRWQRYGR